MPHDLVLLSRGSSARDLCDEATGERTEPAAAASRYDVKHMTTAVRLVRQGLGMTVLPALALPELELGELVACKQQDTSARRMIGVLHRRDRSPSAAATAFAGKLAPVADQLGGRAFLRGNGTKTQRARAKA